MEPPTPYLLKSVKQHGTLGGDVCNFNKRLIEN